VITTFDRRRQARLHKFPCAIDLNFAEYIKDEFPFVFVILA
jgi:hypothetical protein